jgi:hypothetical protein
MAVLYRAGVFFWVCSAAFFIGLTNGLLLGAAKVVIDLIFTGSTNFHEQLEKTPHWIHPFTHWLVSALPEFPPPVRNWAGRWWRALFPPSCCCATRWPI